MGAANKLLADVGGTPMVRRVTQAALASTARPVLVVTGHQAAEVSAALAGLDVTLVANPDYATGLASSLKAGIRALPAGCDGALILLGDMPRIAPGHLDTLIAAFAPMARSSCRCTRAGRATPCCGRPGIFPSCCNSTAMPAPSG